MSRRIPRIEYETAFNIAYTRYEDGMVMFQHLMPRSEGMLSSGALLNRMPSRSRQCYCAHA
ncbi:hypothetical protein ACFOGG_07060 [Brenneria rubrifaciens]|uniref:hypothetical protein n=1 Tax=Brenneria rubrifaciens TaxID=55213 RepID=UPI00360B1EB6